MKKLLTTVTSIVLLLSLTACSDREEEVYDELGLLQRSNEVMDSADSIHIAFLRNMSMSTFDFGMDIAIEGQLYLQWLNRDLNLRSTISADFMGSSQQSTTYFRDGQLFVMNDYTGVTHQTQMNSTEVLAIFSSNLIDTNIHEEDIIYSSFEELDDGGFRLMFKLDHPATIRLLALQGEDIIDEHVHTGHFTLIVYLDDDYRQTEVLADIHLTHLNHGVLEEIELTMDMQIISINDVIVEFPEHLD